MLKKLSIVMVAGVGLMMSVVTFADEPDLRYQQCVDPSDRAEIRALRNLCDDEATSWGYNVGIFRPYNANQDGEKKECAISADLPDPEVYSCLGAPHQAQPCNPSVPPGCG